MHKDMLVVSNQEQRTGDSSKHRRSDPEPIILYGVKPEAVLCFYHLDVPTAY